jgi:hypothetical protein
VYFGEDRDMVADATTTESAGIYGGRQSAEITRYDPPDILELSKTYYWRIDEVNEAHPNSPWKGRVWSFTTTDFVISLVIDDFEAYTEDVDIYEAFIWGVWIGGQADGKSGSQVGYDVPPFAEKSIVHGGRLSMPLFYDNVASPRYSEAYRTFWPIQDWTANDADTLTMHFHGRPGNSQDSLYVAIEDRVGRTTVVTHPDPNAVLTPEWQKWDIPLADLRAAGVDLASVKRLYIGVGNRDDPQPGGTGLVFIDDIWVTKRMP